MANGDSSNPLQQYGYDANTGQQLAQSLGLTTQQLAMALATTPSTSVSQPQSGGQYGMASPGPTTGKDLGGTIQQLQLMKAVGGLGGGNQQSTPANTSASGGPFTDATNLAGRMGAAALGQPQIINPTPGQIPAGSLGGVAQVASPTVSSDVPSVPAGPWNTTAGVFGNQQQAQGMQNWAQNGGSGNPADAAAIEKAQGWAPGTIAQKFAGAGTAPNNNPPPTAGGTPTPVMPANAAGAQPPATPYATAPPAPTMPSVPPAVHNDALQNAGMALYSHMTGNDPATASHSQIADFHTQLTGMIGKYAAGAGSNISPPAGPPPAPGPQRMATGGFVPGRGNTDKVPALLTPGEYVIPKAQAAQLKAPIRMQEGGFVPEDPSSGDDSPEARHRALQLASAAAQATQQTGNTDQQRPSQAPAAPGGYTGPSAQQLAAQYGGTASSATPAGGWPSQTPSVAPSYDMPSDPDPDWQYTGQQSMAGPTGAGAGGASAAAGAAGVAGGLASGLSAAAQTYANSIKPWQWQGQKFNAPSGGQGQQQVAQLKQEQLPSQQERQSPMMTAMYGY